ncbi:SCO family protein [Kangiella shandongensis]|uniref:SCO family protein n=1 Tax=Kangiella shandongensis TaxID=2763258 RepID=UPI001CBDD0F5|nr:SCO family protein [Kangiella shandongensis]
MKQWLTNILISSVLGLAAHSVVIAGDMPGDSIYQLGSQWTTQDEESLNIGQLKGKKQVVSLIYTHCMHTCPTIVATMQEVQKSLPKNEQERVGFVLISLTPDSDTPEVLKSFAKRRKLDPKSWTLLTGSEQDVRSLAMALNIKYKKSDDNEVAHSNLMTVLDENGRVLFQEIGDIDKAQETVQRIISR